MIKSSKTTLKFSNSNKIDNLSDFIKEYQSIVRLFIDLLWEQENIPRLIPKEITNQINSWLSKRAIQCAGKQASAIVRGTRRLSLAQQFVEWVGSVEAQIMASRREFRLPVRVDVPYDSLPEWAQEVRTKMVAEPMDWDLLSRQGAAWISYWDRHVRGKGTSGAER